MFTQLLILKSVNTWDMSDLVFQDILINKQDQRGILNRGGATKFLGSLL